MIRYFYFILIIVDSFERFHSLTTIIFEPNHFSKSDLLIHDFRQEIHSIHPYRCLLQIESKYFYLNPFCQLFTRTSLKSQCSFEDRIKLEIVFPQNTTVREIIIQSNRTDCSSISTDEFCQFEKNPYRIKLKENEIYKNFLQVKTSSSCSSSNFVLSSTNSKRNFEFFSINSNNGFLTLINSLDYETMSTWKLVIQAEDKNEIPFYTYVIIDVDDVNDCPPLLSWNFPLQTINIVNDSDPFHLEISIEESKVEQSNVIIANLIASDLDSQLKFDLKINQTDSIPFRIDGPYGDSTFVLLTSTSLDREIQSRHVLHLILKDYGKPRLTSIYELIINILDVNDHQPKFDQNVYFVDIQENNRINTTLLQVFANDSDSGENGRVTYRFDPNDRDDLFIDSITGIIRTKIRFDYEQLKNLTFYVTASDHPKQGRSLTSTVQVFVNIINQNDNVPQVKKNVFFSSSPHLIT